MFQFKMKKNQKEESHFDKQKAESLASTDLSRKGSVDEDIREFLTRLNEDVNYFSLSSCSGRVVILRQQTRDNVRFSNFVTL
jgi:tRNA wybutosine-synthesizing protein 3